MDNREITLTVNKNKTIRCRQGDNLFKVLSGAGYVFSGNCGGRGACQRCLVDITGKGTVKSCRYTLTEDEDITVKDDCTSILTSYTHNDSSTMNYHKIDNPIRSAEKKLGIAIDLGTTTVAMELVSLTDDSIIDRCGFMNPQIEYGSDVVSRIRTGSTAEGLASLRASVISKISSGIHSMSKIHENISKIVISGNTTMNSILEDLTLENLGHAPFPIKNPDSVTVPADIFFGEETFVNASVTCLPNLSAFVGADALCGAIVCGIHRSDSYQLFADLGTNGELILAKNGIGFATSCACGPAFEGMLKRGTTAPTTTFDLLNRLNKLHVVNDDGVLADQYIENGYRIAGGSLIDMDTIRSFLLAKAAICAGIESLMDVAGICDSDISKVYLAGGFGCSLKISCAVDLGLFPESFQEKAEFAGNTSLYGAHKCLIDKDFIDRIYEFKDTLTAVNLGELDGFDKRYYSHMDLRPWNNT